jgi:hypothetical protein
MFMKFTYMRIGVTMMLQGEMMAAAKAAIAHKHFRLDTVKLKRAQKVLQAPTETEAIERALELVLSEHQRDRLAAEANERFIRSRATIRDVYRTLDA